jgi:uncharacterized protein (TIGR00251 family)
LPAPPAAPALRRTAAGVVLSVRLQPAAAANRIDGIEELADGRRRLRARVTAAAEKGKANKAMIALLAKTLKLPPSTFSVVSGRSSRDKEVAIAGDGAALTAKFNRLYPAPAHKREKAQ